MQKQLWSDSTTDCLICLGYSLVPLFIGGGLVLARANFWAALAVMSVGGLLVLAGVGLQRERRWAAYLATVMFFLFGCWLVSMYFAGRAEELRAG